MDISDYGKSPNLDPIMKDLAKYDLVQNALKLDAYGLTVIPKEKMGIDDDFSKRLKEAILRTCEQRNEVEIGDPDQAGKGIGARSFKNSWYLLQEDDVFVEAALNPRVLTIARWLCGKA